MWYIVWNMCGDTKMCATEEEWDAAIEEIAETTPFDLNVEGNYCYVDDGDPE